MSLEIEDKLAQIKENYVLSLPDKLKDIQNLWLKVCESGEKESLDVMYRLTHSLAGSGATFGQIELSKKAKSLELYVKENADNIVLDNIVLDNIASEINRQLKGLESVIVVDESSKQQKVNATVSPPARNISCVDGNTQEVTESIKILLADDDEDSRTQIAVILRASNHEVFEVSNGQQALEYFDLYNPDLVLLDVVMPIMNGYAAAEIIKKQSQDQFIPLIFLTSVTDNESLAACISSGGDDFLSKPVHPMILDAKIRAMQRIKKAYKKLDEYQKKTEEELEASEHLFNTLIASSHEKIANLNCWSIFPGHFSGDVQLSARLDNGDTYVLLCDFTGHGLPAALGTMFVADMFQSMVKKILPADAMLKEINKKMHSILPVGRYCASVMVWVSEADNKVKVWNNGLPTAYLVDGENRIIEELPSSGLPLGIMATMTAQDFFVLKPGNGCSLVFYSDGVTEAENINGEMYTEQRFVELIEQMPVGSNLFEGIKKELEEYVADTELVDDLSLMILNF